MSRLRQLEDAHRALAAQHTALLEFVRAILPLIPLPAEALQHALVEVYDRSNMHMDDGVMDVEYQVEVRKWLDILSDAAREDTSRRQRTPGLGSFQDSARH